MMREKAFAERYSGNKKNPGYTGELVLSDRYFQTNAAITALMPGAKINTQSCANPAGAFLLVVQKNNQK